MDLEYIEDFDSIVSTVKKMMDMSQQDILYLTFMQFDYNKDGLLTNSDLIELFQNTSGNVLVERDLLRIMDHLKKQKLKDRPSNPELFVTELNYQALKLVSDEEGPQQKRVFNLMKKEVFTMQQPPSENLIKKKSRLDSKKQS